MDLFRATFSNGTRNRGGQKKSQGGVVKAMLNLPTVLDFRRAAIEDLYKYFTAFPNWCLTLECPFPDIEECQQALAQRRWLSSNAGACIRSWTPSTLLANLNGVAALYNTRRGCTTQMDSSSWGKGSFCAPKGVFFLHLCDILSRGTMFSASPFLLLSCIMLCIMSDTEFHVPMLGDG